MVGLYWAQVGSTGPVLTPGGWLHTVGRLRDAIVGSGLPVVAIHLSNPHAREGFRHISMISGVVLGVVQGFGADSYLLGLRALASHLKRVQRG